MRKNGDLHDRVSKAALGAQTEPSDPGALDVYPHLSALLWPKFRAEKCTREAGRLTIKVVGGYYVCSVQCPSEGVQTQIICTQLEGLLDQLEAKLSDPVCIWLPDWQSQKKARQQSRR